MVKMGCNEQPTIEIGQKDAGDLSWTTNRQCTQRTYLPDLILVQLRVIKRWVFAGKSGKVYSLLITSAGG